MAKSVVGVCHICGCYGQLSFEHVPPESAFNKRRILRAEFDKIISAERLDKLPGRFQQRGAGAHTLCAKCNNLTGHWYGSAYADWAHQAMAVLVAARGIPSLIYPFNLFPLRILKQIVCMFFSVNGAGFQKVQSDLVRFVLNRDARPLPDHVRVYAFYTFSNRSRFAGVSGLLRGIGTSSSALHLFSEITFPPFGFVMTFEGCDPPDNRIVDISGFSQFGYNDWRAGVSMKLPVLSIYSGLPGDYRARDQIPIDHEANRRWMENPSA